MKKSTSTEINPSDGSNDLSDYVGLAIEPLWICLEKMEEEQGSSFVFMDPVLREVNRRIAGALEAIKRDIGNIKIHFNFAKRFRPETVLGAELEKE